MLRVALIGAGSVTFAKTLVNDLLFFEPFRDAEFRLMDIDAERIEMTSKTVDLVREQRAANCTFVPTTDREVALKDADFVISMIQIGGHAATVMDFEVCERHGLRFCIGDTMGVPAIARALRTAPVLISLARDMERLCPNAPLLNYSNPMGMVVAATLRGTHIQAVGLCHGVFGTAGRLARTIEADIADVTYLCAGINHMAFFLRYEVNGEDAYPRIRAAFDGPAKDTELVRQEILRRFGYFTTESSYHFPEYCPWFIKHPGHPDFERLIREYDIALDEYVLRSEEGTEIFEQVLKGFREGRNVFAGELEGTTFTPRSRMRTRGGAEDIGLFFKIRDVPSGEYASRIMNAMATHEPFRFNGNVLNHGLITNLPADTCVEVPCLADHNGVQPTHVGDLPPQCAALIRTNLNVQDLTTWAVLEEDRDHVYHAALMDPLAGANLSTDQIVALMDDLIEAEAEWMPGWLAG